MSNQLMGICCVCGVQMPANPVHMCVSCLRLQVDVTEGISKEVPIAWCKGCGRYQHTNVWVAAEPESRELLVLDPMLATGGSASDAITMIKKRGCNHIRLVNLIAAPEGVAKVQADHPDVDIYIAAMDERLNEHAYIVPGLGDAGDRLCGTK